MSDVGLLTLLDYRSPFATILIDGEDVTNRCFSADDREGWVAMFIRGKDGRYLRGARGLVKETRTGKVEISFSETLNFVMKGNFTEDSGDRE